MKKFLIGLLALSSVSVYANNLSQLKLGSKITATQDIHIASGLEYTLPENFKWDYDQDFCNVTAPVNSIIRKGRELTLVRTKERTSDPVRLGHTNKTLYGNRSISLVFQTESKGILNIDCGRKLESRKVYVLENGNGVFSLVGRGGISIESFEKLIKKNFDLKLAAKPDIIFTEI